MHCGNDTYICTLNSNFASNEVSFSVSRTSYLSYKTALELLPLDPIHQYEINARQVTGSSTFMAR